MEPDLGHHTVCSSTYMTDCVSKTLLLYAYTEITSLPFKPILIFLIFIIFYLNSHPL